MAQEATSTSSDRSDDRRSRGEVRDTRRLPFPLDLYRSAVGKKYVMAVTGIVLIGYVFAHMVGNLKVFLGRGELNRYADFLRTMGEPILPRTTMLWSLRVVVAVAFGLHIHAAYALTRMNHRARADGYAASRQYLAANFASRTMRWSGVIVGLFVIFHLIDLTWGTANPDFVRGDVYHNVVASLSRAPIAVVYVIANVALAVHIFHGAWSLFQSLGWNNPLFNRARLWFARILAFIILAGNVSIPVMVQLGVVRGGR